MLKHHKGDPRMDLIEMAMRGGKMGFGKIIKMIDNLVVELKAEQGIDNDKKSYCLAEFDKAEDKKKGLELDISDLGKAIDDGEESIETLAGNNAAKDLLAFAKNRLNKFYNPKLYKAPPKRELSEEDRIVVNMG